VMRLFRSLTDTDDTEYRDLVRLLLITASEYFATGEAVSDPCAQPLLEHLPEGHSTRNRRLGRHPQIAEAFAAERAVIGRVTRENDHQN
jgi:hypothetical protein